MAQKLILYFADWLRFVFTFVYVQIRTAEPGWVMSRLHAYDEAWRDKSPKLNWIAYEQYFINHEYYIAKPKWGEK